MNFRNVFLLLKREIRDQLRDRRMLFMIFVLPLLLYPMMGIFMSQAGQYATQKPSRIFVFVPRDFEQTIQKQGIFPLFELDENNKPTSLFNESLFSGKEKQLQLETQFQTVLVETENHSDFEQEATNLARKAIDVKECDAALLIPPSFLESLQKIHDQIRPRRRSQASTNFGNENVEALIREIPRPNVIYSTATQKSLIARNRLENVLDSWNQLIGTENIKKGGLNPEVASPIHVQSNDIAEKTRFKGASLWSKSLPIFLLLWALTGAFYPAIDLCAGEKERGTLETLLSSPAARMEIVLSKLLTVMTFSVLTSILNILCLALTGYFLISRLMGIGIPPVWTPLWLMIALIPAAALFSALCIALSVYAKSTKEGQYYLTPLLLIIIPLVLLPVTSDQELTLGTAIIPITGIVQVLGSLLEGDYREGFTYLPIVALVTLLCCYVAIRWSVEQFNSEAVLFRESERFDLKIWFKRTFRTKIPRPTAQMALICGVLILGCRYFLNFASEELAKPENLVANLLVSQFVGVLLPVLLLAALCSSSFIETFRLSRPNFWALPVVFLLAVSWHPINIWLQSWVVHIYPLSPAMQNALESLQDEMPKLAPWLMFMLIAVLPGFCEELAFRGYIFSGLNTQGHHIRAILISALFFGAVHTILQQSILATITGILLGWIAFQTGSLWTTILFHITHNGINALVPDLGTKVESGQYWIYTPWGTGLAMLFFIILVMILCSKKLSQAKIKET